MVFFLKQPRPTKIFRDIPGMLAYVQAGLKIADPDFVTATQRAIETLRAQIT